MINQFYGILKSSIKPAFRWTSVSTALKKSREQGQPSVVVSMDTDHLDFAKRYRNVRITAIVSAACVMLSFVFLLFAQSMTQVLFCLAGMVLFSMFYIRYSMLMWLSRRCWENWDKRGNKVLVTGATFFKVVMENPKEILPLQLTWGDNK